MATPVNLGETSTSTVSVLPSAVAVIFALPKPTAFSTIPSATTASRLSEVKTTDVLSAVKESGAKATVTARSASPICHSAASSVLLVIVTVSSVAGFSEQPTIANMDKHNIISVMNIEIKDLRFIVFLLNIYNKNQHRAEFTYAVLTIICTQKTVLICTVPVDDIICLLAK